MQWQESQHLILREVNFICLNENTNGYQHLDGNYTTFGRVIEGIDIVDKLREGDKMLEVTTSTDPA